MKRALPILLLALLLCACGTQPAQQPLAPAQTPRPSAVQPSYEETTDPSPVPSASPVTVYDAYCAAGDYTDDVGNTWHYTLRIPAIQAQGEDAERISRQLYDTLLPYVDEANSAMEGHYSLVTCNVDYVSYRNGSLLSILARVDNDWGQSLFCAVNFDTETLKEVDRSAILARYGLTEEQFLPLAADTVDRYIQAEWANIPHDDFWDDRHDRSIAPENFTEDCQLYVNADGQLCMIVKLYSFAGADYYYHKFLLS